MYNFSDIKVLIIETNQAMFDLTTGVLKRFGIHQIRSAFDVKSGFTAFQEFQPDLVLIDWLDEKNGGLKLTGLLRDTEKSINPFVPIIMMTGYSQKRRVLMARDTGITEFMVKPFTAKALYDKIEAIIERPREFVKAGNFFGPDRRRKRTGYEGPERRQGERKAKTPSEIVRRRMDETPAD